LVTWIPAAFWQDARVSIMQFVAAMSSAWSWPVFAGLLLVTFRGELRSWLSVRPSRAKLGPVDLEWDQQATAIRNALPTGNQVAETQAGSPAATPAPEVTSGGVPAQMLTRTATASPAVAVEEAAQAVQARLVSMLDKSGSSLTGSLNLAGLARLAADRGTLDATKAQSVAGLSVLRELSRAGHPVAPAQAREFVSLADSLMHALG
jgi:hypothetical protein